MKNYIQKYRKAPLVNRLISYFIDWYLTAMLISLPVTIFASIENNDLVLSNTITNLEPTHAVIAFVSGIILITCYFTYPAFFKKYDGQTIGKHIVGIKVIRKDQQAMKFKDYFLRYIIGLVFIEQNLNIAAFSFRSLLTMFVPQIVVDVIYYIGIAICAVSIILVFANKDHHMLHDMIAKTEVVELKPLKK